ncbi:MAG: hypothetical protein M1838_000212 [Thelocarpon superellum]|nr:MAG: hypothetical protein M1838_000212 [Thelocarpon superellum]
MCHTSCALFNAGNLASYLSVIEAWLSRPANAREILTLLLVNSNDLGANQFGKSFTDAGLQNYTFQPASNPNALAFRDWPTLQQMIDAGTRLVVFMDSQADVTTVPYILPEWDYFFETPYDVTNASSLDQGCPLDRPANTQPDGKMYIVNHFLDETAAFLLGATVPDIDLLPQTNAATGFGSIGNQVQSCEQIYEQPPKFVLVDFYDKGDVFVAEKKMNGVSSPN